MSLKKISAIILSAALLFTSAIAFAANGDKNSLESLLAENYIEGSTEKAEISQVISDSIDHITELILGEYTVIYRDEDGNYKRKTVSAKNGKLDFKTQNSFKMYQFNPDVIIFEEYEKEHDFGKFISENYRWAVPVYDENGEIINTATYIKGAPLEEKMKSLPEFKTDKEKEEYIERLKEREGKWYLCSVGPILPLDEISFVSDRNKIMELLSEAGLENPSEIKYVMRFGPLDPDILYIKNGNDEYAIPFCSRPEFAKVENRKLYKMSEYMDIQYEIFKERYKEYLDQKE